MVTAGVDMTTWEPDYTDNPYPFYERCRRVAPATRVIYDGVPAWLVTSYADVRRLLADPTIKQDLRQAGPSARAVPWVGAGNPHVLNRSLLRLDPPEHTRVRKLVSKVFTPKRVEALRPRIQQITDGLVAGLLPRGRADLIAEFGLPLSMTVISEQLGVPEQEAGDFLHWANIYVGIMQGSPQDRQRALGALHDCVGRIIESRKTGRAGETILDDLIAVRDAGEGFSHDELMAMGFLLLIAGYETTNSLIGNGMFALLRNPGQLAALRAGPARLGAAIEEFLRYESPVHMPPALRFTTTEVSLGDELIPAGETLLLCLGAANRDPERFESPDAVDTGRDASGHLAFGYGPHFCVGASLARLEAGIAFTALLTRFPGLRLDGEPAWRRIRVIRSLTSLPVAFTPTTSE